MYGKKPATDTVKNLTGNSFWKNVVVDNDIVTDKRTGKVLGPEVGYAY